MSELICRIDDYLAETAGLLDQLDRAAIGQAAELLLECYRRHGRVWTLGNGGSASTAQHFACDLAKSGHHIDDTVRNAGLGGQFAEADRRQ